MKRFVLTLAALCVALAVAAQEPVVIPVWPAGPPVENGLTGPEPPDSNGYITNSHAATMWVYPADSAKNTGTALVICPGGGYSVLAIDHEGHDIARWLARNGVTGVVLKYRMPNGNQDIPIADAREALRIVRRRAAEWGVDPAEVGISGSSAGGHLAAITSTLYEDEAGHPDYAVLFYPVVQWGGRRAAGNPEAAARYSADQQVNEHTPPMIFFHSDDDGVVPPTHSVALYTALKEARIPAALHIFPTGGHGWGYRPSFRYHEVWKTLLLKWLEDMKFTAK
ncbi:MAG: alpha/beta hydrolase [Alistipes sp.]|jgi:acetyl esterase/lipase|nr:alpha/beta hydrolase [Alistipes sp.]